MLMDSCVWLAINTLLQNWDTYGVMWRITTTSMPMTSSGQLVWIPWDNNNEALSVDEGRSSR